jgi:hypothetical protein
VNNSPGGVRVLCGPRRDEGRRFAFGKRYVIEGIMKTADGRMPLLRSVWFIERGADTARFTTAYPLRREEDD